MACSIITTADALEGLQDEWNALSKQWASPVFDHAWFVSAARSIHAADEIRVHVIRENGRLVAAAPLALNTGGGRRLALIGVSRLYEPSGWLFADTTAVAELALMCVRSGECTILQRVPDFRPLASTLAGAVRGRAVTFSRALAPSYGVDSSRPWDDYVRGLARHKARSLEKRRHRAEKTFGRWVYEMHRPGPDEIEAYVEAFARLEASGWKGRQGSALAHRPDLWSFFLEYGRRAAANQQFRVAQLRFGPRLAASELAIEAHGRLWSLKIGHDEALSEFAPALQLTHESIRSAFESGLQSYEFLGVAAPWQERWLPTRRDYGLIAMYPLSLRGLSTLAVDSWHSVASRARA